MLPASSRSARLRAEDRSGSVAATSPMAKTSGRALVCSVGPTSTKPCSSSSGAGTPPGLGRAPGLQRRADLDEAVLVEQRGGAPPGVGADPADGPDDRLGLGRRLPGA